jgi:two-component system OmpR family sensor kinase
MMLIPILLVITAGFGVFGFYVDGVEYRNRIADVDEELTRAQTGAARQLDAATGTAAGNDTSGTVRVFADGVEPPVQLVVRTDGSIISEGNAGNPFDPATVRELARLDGVRTVDSVNYRARVTPRRGDRVTITALPLAQVDASVADFRRALAAGGAVMIALQGLVVWLVTSRLIRPVTRMTQTATRVADGELDTEVGPPSGSRETATLAIDLDRMLTRLRSTLANSEKSAAEATKARDEMQRFLADVSHEIRTPLTALRGYSDLYAKGMLTEPGALDRAMGRVGNESNRLHGLVSNMLQLARNGSTTTPTEVFDAAEVLHDVALDLRSAHPDRQISLDIDASTDHLMQGSPGEVHQAVLNLGANACKHTATDIGIEMRATDTDLVICVIDHGPGIDPDVADKIFQPFFRVDSSRTRGAGGGAGLGLALTKQIVDRHHGAITQSATPGGGATFQLTFPRHRLSHNR